MLRAVIFDIDDTLYEFLPIHTKSLKKVYLIYKRYENIRLPEFISEFKKSWKELKNNIGNTASSSNRILIFQNLVERRLKKFNGELVLKLYTCYWNNFLSKIKLYPGVKRLFGKLRKNNITIGIITDLITINQIKKINKLKINDYVDVFVGSEECGVNKPNKIVFNLIVKKLRVKPDEILMVGDNESNDIKGAKKLGMKSIHLLRGSFINKTKNRNVSDYYAKDFNEISSIIRKIIKN